MNHLNDGIQFILFLSTIFIIQLVSIWQYFLWLCSTWTLVIKTTELTFNSNNTGFPRYLPSVHTFRHFGLWILNLQINKFIFYLKISIFDQFLLMWKAKFANKKSANNEGRQSNLCTTTTLWTLIVMSVVESRCSEVAVCYKSWTWESRMMVAVRSSSLAQV